MVAKLKVIIICIMVLSCTLLIAGDLQKKHEDFVKKIAEAQAAAKLGRLDKAIDLYVEALEMYPKKPDYLKTFRLELTRLYYNAERYKEAVEHLKASILEYPEKLDLQRALIISHIQLGDTQTAKPLLETFLKNHPKDWEAIAAWGALQYALQDYAGALEKYQQAEPLAKKATKMFPIPIHHAIVKCHLALKDYKTAVTEYLLIQKTTPNDVELFYDIASAYEKDGQKNKATVNYQKYYDLTDIYNTHHREVAKKLDKPIKEN